MCYREPVRISELATVLRYYAAIIESGALGPPPEHLLLPDETVEAFRYLAMVLDIEAGERLAAASSNGGDSGALPVRHSLPDFEQRFGPIPAATVGTGSTTGAQSARRLPHDFAEKVQRRRQPGEHPEGAPTDEGEGSGAGSRLAPGMAPRTRRRRGPQ